MNVKIRSATMKDCAACQKLGRVPELAITPGRYLPIEAYQAYVRTKQFFLVATVGKRMVGFSMAERLTGRGVLLQYIVTAKSFRGRGIGSQLFEATLARCRRAGIMWALAYAVAENRHIQAMFKRAGFLKNHRTYEYSRQLQYWPSERGHKKRSRS